MRSALQRVARSKRRQLLAPRTGRLNPAVRMQRSNRIQRSRGTAAGRRMRITRPTRTVRKVERQVRSVLVRIRNGHADGSSRRSLLVVQVERLQRMSQLDLRTVQCGWMERRRPRLDWLVSWRRRCGCNTNRRLQKCAESPAFLLGGCVTIFRFQTQILRFFVNRRVHICQSQVKRVK